LVISCTVSEIGDLLAKNCHFPTPLTYGALVPYVERKMGLSSSEDPMIVA